MNEEEKRKDGERSKPKCRECGEEIKLEQSSGGLSVFCRCASAGVGYNPNNRWSSPQ